MRQQYDDSGAVLIAFMLMAISGGIVGAIAGGLFVWLLLG